MPIDLVRLDRVELLVCLAQLVPERYARRNGLVALDRVGMTLMVATVDAADLAALDAVAAMTRLHVEPVTATLDEIKLAVRIAYVVPHVHREVHRAGACPRWQRWLAFEASLRQSPAANEFLRELDLSGEEL